jgi:hypothetical protein
MSNDQQVNFEDEEAGAWMKRGIASLQAGTPEALREAVRCFEIAIEMRRKLPLENLACRYKLAASLINRGDALTRLGAVENSDDAIHSHTEAVALLQAIPPDDGGLYLKRLAIAWINRGLALELKGDQAALEEAVSSCRKAIDLLEGSPLAIGGEFVLIKAGVRVNYGNALLRSSGDAIGVGATEACEVAAQALALIAGIESSEPAAAEIGFKARHVLCQSLVALQMIAPPEEASRMDFIGRLTDTVEDGLRLAREWEKGGVTAFRGLATRLFHVGVLVYETGQPHFLAEFLLDYLDPERATCIVPVDLKWFAMADESLSRVRHQLQISSFESLATEQGKRRMELLGQLGVAQAKLQALRHQIGKPAE